MELVFLTIYHLSCAYTGLASYGGRPALCCTPTPFSTTHQSLPSRPPRQTNPFPSTKDFPGEITPDHPLHFGRRALPLVLPPYFAVEVKKFPSNRLEFVLTQYQKGFLKKYNFQQRMHHVCFQMQRLGAALLQHRLCFCRGFCKFCLAWVNVLLKSGFSHKNFTLNCLNFISLQSFKNLLLEYDFVKYFSLHIRFKHSPVCSN